MCYNGNIDTERGRRMREQRKNICKLIDRYSGDSIKVSNFVYETKVDEVMKMMTVNERHVIYLVVNGSGFYKTEYFERPIQVGTLFLSFSGERFLIKNQNQLHYIYISFEGGRADDLFSRFGINKFNCVFQGYEGLVSFWMSSIEKANEGNVDLISESVLLYTFSSLAPQVVSRQQGLLESILGCVESNYTSPDFSLAVCSDALGYNQKYISRVFKDNMNVTFSEYLRNVRVRHAIFLMDQGVTSVKNVAMLSGYRDPLYFSNVFKQATGMSPSEYMSRGDEGEEN